MALVCLSSFTLAVVAVFRASGKCIPYVQLVDVLKDESGLVTRRGMEIEVDPPLFKDGKLVPLATGPGSYTLRLKIKQVEDSEFQIWENDLHCDISDYAELYAARRKKVNDRVSMNEKKSHSDSTQNSESKSDPFAIQKTRSEVEQLLKKNIVHHEEGVTSVDPLYFIEEKKGFYLFRFHKKDVKVGREHDEYRVYFERVMSDYHEEISENEFKDMSWHLSTVKFKHYPLNKPTEDVEKPEQYLQEYNEWSKKSYMQEPIAFNPGIVPLIFSGTLYASFKTFMEKHILENVNSNSKLDDKNFLVNGRYEIKCKLLEPLLEKSRKFFSITLHGKFVKDFNDAFTWRWKMKFWNNPDLIIFPDRFIVKRGDKGDETCILDIVEGVSEETIASGSLSPQRKAVPSISHDVAESVPVELITLGSSLLKHCAVSIDNAGDQKMYQIFTNDRTSQNLHLLNLFQ